MNWFDYIDDRVDKRVRKQSCCTITKRVSNTDPSVNDIKEGTANLWINTLAGTVKIYYNFNGILHSVTLD